jgi:hypothetical protein
VTESIGVGIYRRLLRLYPRRFRDEYGRDMALLLVDQLRDEPAGRVWARGIVDLAITLPTRHLEAHMNRPPNAAVATLFTTVSAAGLLLAAVGGTSLGVLTVGLVTAGISGGLAVASWRRNRFISSGAGITAHWWKYLVAGAVTLGTLIAVTTATGEVDGSLWWPMMITVLCSMLLLGVGLVLGTAHLLGSRGAAN